MLFHRFAILFLIGLGPSFEAQAVAARAGPVLERVSARACRQQALRQGLRVIGFGRFDAVTGSGGRLIGAQTLMTVRRAGGAFQVRCNYTPADRRARITPLAEGPATAPAQAVTGSWEWVRFTSPVERIDVPDPGKYTLRFGADGRVAMRADCNRGAGAYRLVGREVTIGPIALTRAMCLGRSLSDRFAREVGRATVASRRGDMLLLELPADSGTLLFRRGVTPPAGG